MQDRYQLDERDGHPRVWDTKYNINLFFPACSGFGFCSSARKFTQRLVGMMNEQCQDYIPYPYDKKEQDMAEETMADAVDAATDPDLEVYADQGPGDPAIVDGKDLVEQPNPVDRLNDAIVSALVDAADAGLPMNVIVGTLENQKLAFHSTMIAGSAQETNQG